MQCKNGHEQSVKDFCVEKDDGSCMEFSYVSYPPIPSQ